MALKSEAGTQNWLRDGGRLLMSLCCCDNVNLFSFKGLELQLLPFPHPHDVSALAHCCHCRLIRSDSQKPPV